MLELKIVMSLEAFCLPSCVFPSYFINQLAIDLAVQILQLPSDVQNCEPMHELICTVRGIRTNYFLPKEKLVL
jgi:hypothetical protein